MDCTLNEDLHNVQTSLQAGVKSMVRFNDTEIWLGGKDGTVASYHHLQNGEIQERHRLSIAIRDSVTSLCWVTLPTHAMVDDGMLNGTNRRKSFSQYSRCRLWCGCQNGRILVLNVELGKVEHNFIAHGATIQAMFQVEGVSFTEEGSSTTVVWSASPDWCTRIYDAVTARMLKKITINNHWFRSMVFIPSTHLVWAAVTDKSICFYKPNGDHSLLPNFPRGRLRLDSEVYCMEHDAMYDRIWTSDDTHLRIYNPQTYEEVHKVEEFAKCICFGDALAWVGGNRPFPNTVTAFHRKDFSKIHQIVNQPWLGHLVYLPPFVLGSSSTSSSLYLFHSKPQPQEPQDSLSQSLCSLSLADSESGPLSDSETSSPNVMQHEASFQQAPPSPEPTPKADAVNRLPRKKRLTQNMPRAPPGPHGKHDHGKVSPTENGFRHVGSTTKDRRVTTAGSWSQERQVNALASAALAQRPRSTESPGAVTPGSVRSLTSPHSQNQSARVGAGAVRPSPTRPGQRPKATMRPAPRLAKTSPLPTHAIPRSSSDPAIPSSPCPTHSSPASLRRAGTPPPEKQKDPCGDPASSPNTLHVPSPLDLGTAPRPSLAVFDVPDISPLQQGTVVEEVVDGLIDGIIPCDLHDIPRVPTPTPCASPKGVPLIPKLRITPAMQANLFLYEERVLPAVSARDGVEVDMVTAENTTVEETKEEAAEKPADHKGEESDTTCDPAPLVKGFSIPFIPKLNITPAMQRNTFLFEDCMHISQPANGIDVPKATVEAKPFIPKLNITSALQNNSGMSPLKKEDIKQAIQQNGQKKDELSDGSGSGSSGPLVSPDEGVDGRGDDKQATDEGRLDDTDTSRDRSGSVTTLGLRPPSPMEGPPATPTISNLEEVCKVFIPPLAIPGFGHSKSSPSPREATPLYSPGKALQHCATQPNSPSTREMQFAGGRRFTPVSPLFFGRSPNNSHRNSPQVPKWLSARPTSANSAKSPKFVAVPSFISSTQPNVTVTCSLPVLEDLDLSRRSSPNEGSTPVRQPSISSASAGSEWMKRNAWGTPANASGSLKGRAASSLTSALPRSAPSDRGLAYDGLSGKTHPGMMGSFHRGPVTRSSKPSDDHSTGRQGHRKWAESWLDFGWSPADSFWQHQLAELFAAYGYTGLRPFDSTGQISPTEAKYRRQYLAQQLRNFVAFAASKGAEGSKDDQLHQMQTTVQQVLGDMEVLTSNFEKSKDAAHAAADFHKVVGLVTRLRNEFFPNMACDGCPSQRSTTSSNLSPSLDSNSSCSTLHINSPGSPTIQSAWDDTEPLGSEAQMVMRVLEAMKDHMRTCQTTPLPSAKDQSPGHKRSSLSLGDLPDLICHMQSSLEEAHKREAQFISQSRERYERTLAMQSELKTLEADKSACTVAFSDALIRLSENLDFLALLAHCEPDGAAGRLSDFISMRFGAIDAQTIKASTDMMLQRLRAVECKLRDMLCTPTEPSLLPSPHTDLD